MISPKQCARCGTGVSPDALWGLCHKCLFDEATALPSGEGILSAKNRRFGDYELGVQLGRGGMGVVYEAVQVSLRRPVALKMVLDSEAGSPLAHRRFRVEAEAAAKLDHPNIVPIYEVGEHEGQSFLSMKFIAGNTLREKIAAGDLCLKPKGNATSRTDLRHRTVAIVQLMATIARAVDHAHEKNVLHRDLKPSNILVDREGQPHLTDFGLAKMLEFDIGKTPAVALTISGTTLGTPSYMSPEQAAGQRLSAASDIYSLGAILYEMLTGDPPFKAATVLETLRLVADQQPRRPSVENPRIDRDLDTICLKCLEKNPAARYTSALALAEDLERWLRQEPIRARPAGVPLRIGRWVKRNRPAAALIVSLFFGFAMALELLHLAHQRQKRLEVIRANNTQMFNEEIETLWRDTNRTYIHIHSVRLAQLVDADLRPPGPHDVRLTFAAVIDADPWGQAMKYAPLFTIIEERMEKLCGRSVFIDLRLYKFSGDGGQAPVTLGEVDFQRLGPVRFIQASRAQPGLELIVREILPKEGVIFARKELGITDLSQVSGLRVAFAHTNSTISFLSKVHLKRAGLSAGHFSMVSNLVVIRWSRDLSSPKGSGRADLENESDGYAHREVMQHVQEGLFDIGEGPRRYFDMNKNRKKGLVELRSFPVVADVVVAKAGLSAELIDAFRQSLLSLRSKHEHELLSRLKHDLKGYAQVNDRDYDDLRSMLTNEVARFESSAPPQSKALSGRPRTSAIK
jgi:tRNA A-37 threonylcarbamoyl transferase component Bud32/ABC-type phosphate/phosphonate transport system substrate-binding protein